MAAVTNPPTLATMADELAAAVAGRPGWQVKPPPSACSVRADYRHTDWHCVVVGTSDGWHWSAWRGIQCVRPITNPCTADVGEAVRLIEETVGG